MTLGPWARLAAAEHVRCRQFDGDLVMVDLQGGEYFALDEVGARMWALLTGGKTPAEVANALSSEYDARSEDILRDCVSLATELVQRGLLVERQP